MPKRLAVPLVFLISVAFCLTAVADNDYLIKPGDVLEISVWNEPELQREVLVIPDGSISFPLVGIIKASNRTATQLRDLIVTELSKLIPDPEVSLSVVAVVPSSVYVIGKVNNPGAIQLVGPTDVMQALSIAGGLTAYAQADNIRILRREKGSQKVISFNYGDIEKGRNLEANVLLQGGDTIVVP